MAPGIYGGGDGRPHPSPVMKFYSCLIPKEAVDIKVAVGPKESPFRDVIPSNPSPANPPTHVATLNQAKEESKKENVWLLSCSFSQELFGQPFPKSPTLFVPVTEVLPQHLKTSS
jgi:hypothetical protein